MKKMLRGWVLGTAAGTLGLAACDAGSPPEAAVSPPAASEPVAPGETLEDLVSQKLAEVLRDDDAYSRARRLGTLLPTLGPELVPAVTQTLDDRLLDYRAPELDLLLRYWATHEPEEASLWARRLAPPDYRAAAVFTTLRIWSETDPLAATSAAWTWGVDDLVLERVAPIALVRGWYQLNDPPELAEWMRSLPPGILRQRVIAAYIRALMEAQGSDAAIRWAESLPEEPESYKLAAFRRLTDTLTALDPQAGVRMCEAHCRGPYGDNMRSLIARRWVAQDGPAALAWLSTARPGSERNLAVRVTFAKWSRADREAAQAWMATQITDGELEPWLASAIPVYARLIAEEAPLEAIEWVKRIEHDGERQILLIDVLRVWRYLDEAAAEQWMLQAALSEQALEKVRAPLQQSPLRRRLEQRAAVGAAAERVP